MLVCSNQNLTEPGTFAKFLAITTYLAVSKSDEVVFITDAQSKDAAMKEFEEIYGINNFKKFYKLQDLS